MPTITNRHDYSLLQNDTSFVESCAAHVCIKVFTGAMKAKSDGCNDIGEFYIPIDQPHGEDISYKFGITPEKPFDVYSKGTTPRSLRVYCKEAFGGVSGMFITLRIDGEDIGGTKISCQQKVRFVYSEGESWRTVLFPEWFCPAKITKIVLVDDSGFTRGTFAIGFGDAFQIPYRFTVIPVYLCNTQVNTTTAVNTTVTWNNYTEDVFSTIKFSGDSYDSAKDTSLILFY